MNSPADVSVDDRTSRARSGEWPKLGSIAPILVIEDNYLAAADLMRLLEEWDVPTRCVGQAAAARALAREMRPKLALVDINLAEGYEGIELALEMQSLYRTKIVFVTAYHVRDLMHRLAGAEHIAVLFKPVEPDVLAIVLSDIAATIEAAN
jgi:two-component system, response regulator PdtaR